MRKVVSKTPPWSEGAGGFGVAGPLNWLKTKKNGELIQRQTVKKLAVRRNEVFYLATPGDPGLGGC